MELFVFSNFVWQRLDTNPNEPIYTTRQIGDLATMKPTADGTLEITLPKTHRNASILHYLDTGVVSPTKPYETLPARIVEASVTIFGAGATLHILSTQSDGYHCAVVAGNSSFMDTLKALDFTTTPPPAPFTESNAPFWQGEQRTFDQTYPKYYINDIVRSIVRRVGYSIEGIGTAINAQWTVCDRKRDPALIGNRSHLGVWEYYILQQNNTEYKLQFTDLTECPDAQIIVNVDIRIETLQEQIYTPEQCVVLHIGNTEIELYVGDQSLHNNQPFKNGERRRIELLNVQTENGLARMRLSHGMGTGMNDKFRIFVDIDAFVIHDNDFALPNEPILPYYNSGFITAYDLFQTWIQLNAFFVEVDEQARAVTVFSMQHLYSNKQNALNWTKKLADKPLISYKLANYARNNRIVLKENPLQHNRQLIYSFTSHAQGIEQSRDFLNINLLSGNRWHYPFHDADGKFQKLPAPYCLLTSSNDNKTRNIADNDLEFLYENIRKIARHPFVIEVKVHLTPLEYKDFRYTTPIYIEYFGRHFYCQELSNYDGNTATAKLIAL